MRLEQYTFTVYDDFKTFDFLSIGPKGAIKKRIQIQETTFKNVYNLAFGDVNSETNDFDDIVISNNFDTAKVLATVAHAVYLFLQNNPNTYVYAEGSTPSRTRLYQMLISKNFEEIQTDFEIFGLSQQNIWVKYEINTPYLAFYVKKKI